MFGSFRTKRKVKRVFEFGNNLRNRKSVSGIFALVIGNVKDFESVDKLASYFGIVPRVSNSNETVKITDGSRKEEIKQDERAWCSAVYRQSRKTHI
jgi:transposase